MILDGKTAIITGPASGLGAATAVRFSREGANLTLVDLDEAGLRRIEAECRKGGAGVLTIAGDAADLTVMDEAVQRTVETFGGIDILVNNMIYRVYKPFSEVGPEEFRRSLEVNVAGYFFLTQKVLPQMLRRGGGSIVNLSSVFGYVGCRDLAPYCVTKGAVVNMTRALALELADKNVRVNAVAPGPIETEGLMSGAISRDPARVEKRLAEIPLRRMGTPEEVAGVCLFLASDASGYMNGHNLVADGGFMTH